MVKVVCLNCGNSTDKRPCDIKKNSGMGFFCSISCFRFYASSEAGRNFYSKNKTLKYKLGITKSGFKKGKLNYTAINGSPCKGKKKQFTEEHKASMRKPKKDTSKMKLNKQVLVESGWKPHNTGKTKYNYEPLMRASKNTSKTRKLRIAEGKINPFHGMNIKPNIPENKLIDIIESNSFNFKYVGDGRLWIIGENHSFNPDFVDEDNKLIIELFGKYWHTSKEAIEKDKERLVAYSNEGYKTLIIWDYELTEESKVLNKINSFIKEEEIEG